MVLHNCTAGTQPESLQRSPESESLIVCPKPSLAAVFAADSRLISQTFQTHFRYHSRSADSSPAARRNVPRFDRPRCLSFVSLALDKSSLARS